MSRWLGVVAVTLTMFLTAGCSAKASSTLQRQALETSYIDGPFKTIFQATRTAFQNEGYMVAQSEIESGFLRFTKDIPNKSAGLAFGLGFLPGGGSFYVGSYGLGVVDLLLWPWSVLWDPAISAAKASNSSVELDVTVTMVDLGARSEIRTTFSGADVSGEYGIQLKRLYAEIQRQVMMREHPVDRRAEPYPEPRP